MGRRDLLSAEERQHLFGIPTYPDTLARLHTFEPTDLGLIDARREERNRLGFAIQLALVRHPGPTQAQVATQPGLDLEPLVGFIARQLDLSAAALTDYAAREQTSTDRRLTLIACRLYRQAEQAARAERLQLSEVIPTRSGKGVGLVIPSLLTWPGSATFLEDPSIVEVMLNPDGRLWIDRLSGGLEDSGRTLSAADGERIVRLVAHHVGAEVHAERPRVSAELPETGCGSRGCSRRCR